MTSLPADTKETCARKVALYESQGETSVFIYAEINREGVLTLSEQDVGKTPEAFRDVPDYEYCIVISKEHKDRLRCALMEREFWEDIPWHSMWKTMFPLFTTVFEDLAISAEDFRQFLRSKGIPFEEPGTIDAHHNDDVLIALMERAFGGNPRAGREFHEFLESNKISFTLFDGHRSSGSPRTATEILGGHDMEQDMITPDNVTKEMLKTIFDAAFMETSFDSDGDLRVTEEISCFFLLREDRIRLHSVFGFKPHISQEQKLEFVNKINKEYIIVRASVGSSNDKLIFDYDIPLRGGIRKIALVQTVKRFLSIPRPAIKEFGDDLVE